jgi:hypothetical protein
VLEVGPPLVQRRAEALLGFLAERPSGAFTQAELALASGLRPQQAAIVLLALAEVDCVSAVYDQDGRRLVWRLASSDPSRASLAWASGTMFSVSDAAELTGRSPEALRARIARGTLRATRVGKRLYVSYADLRLAGLVGASGRRTETALGMRFLVDRLKRQPRDAPSAWMLSSASRLSRQTVEVAMAALTAAGYVEREVQGGIVWTWR